MEEKRSLAENVVQNKNLMKKSYKTKSLFVILKEKVHWSRESWNSKGTPGGHQTFTKLPSAHLRLQRLWRSTVVCRPTCSPSRLGCL